MADIEAMEIARYHKEIEHELHGVMNKFMRILEWDIPEADEAKARKLILAEIHKVVARMVSEG